MMKARLVILSAILALLLLAATVWAQPWGQCVVPSGSVSGGNYHLTALTWHVSGTAGGGAYRLLAPSRPSLRGSGCCCNYLPLVPKDHD